MLDLDADAAHTSLRTRTAQSLDWSRVSERANEPRATTASPRDGDRLLLDVDASATQRRLRDSVDMRKQLELFDDKDDGTARPPREGQTLLLSPHDELVARRTDRSVKWAAPPTELARQQRRRKKGPRPRRRRDAPPTQSIAAPTPSRKNPPPGPPAKKHPSARADPGAARGLSRAMRRLNVDKTKPPTTQ